MSSTVQFDGLQSGIKTKEIVDALAKTRERPIERLAREHDKLQTKVDLYNQIRSQLTSINERVSLMSLRQGFNKVSALVSDDKALQVSAGSDANAAGPGATGSYDVHVETVAQAQRDYSKAFSSDTEAGLFEPGTLVIRAGNQPPKIVRIDENTTLQGLASTITGLNVGINAQVVYDKNQYMLQLNGLEKGAANSITYEGGEALLGLTAEPAVAAQDTRITVDGKTFTSSSETVNGAIPGATMAFTDRTQQGKTVTVRLEVNSQGIKEQLEEFVTMYNELVRTIYQASKLRTKDMGDGAESRQEADAASTQRESPLYGDSSMSMLLDSLRRAMQDAIAGVNDGAPNTAAAVGLKPALSTTGGVESDGTVTIDEKQLEQMVLKFPKEVAQVFVQDPILGTHGVFSRVQSVFKQFAAVDGVLSYAASSMKDQIRDSENTMVEKQQQVDSYRNMLTRRFVDLEKFMSKYKVQGAFLDSIASTLQQGR